MTETMRVAESEYPLLVKTIMIVNVGVLEQLPKRNCHAMNKLMLS